jgi:hypothetical protein
MLMAAMETTEVSGHVATTEAAAEMTAAETATMAPHHRPRERVRQLRARYRRARPRIAFTRLLFDVCYRSSSKR